MNIDYRKLEIDNRNLRLRVAIEITYFKQKEKLEEERTAALLLLHEDWNNELSTLMPSPPRIPIPAEELAAMRNP